MRQNDGIMNTREKILEAVLKNQPPSTTLPDISMFKGASIDLVQKYIDIFKTIGGSAFLVDDTAAIKSLIAENFDAAKRIVTTFTELDGIGVINPAEDPHQLENIDLAILKGHFGVAENAAVWLTEDLMTQRVLPFICQYLAVVINEDDIVGTMHQAYEKIGSASYNFATFIAGPSKTADIEQSLVLGAHGPKGMTVFIMRGDSRSPKSEIQ